MEPRNGHAVCPQCGRAGDAAALRPLAIAHSVAQAGMPTVLLGPLIPGHLQSPEDTAAAIAAWIDRHLKDTRQEVKQASPGGGA
jgi:hypothetical protein